MELYFLNEGMETLLELEEKEHEGGGIEQKELSPQELLDGEKTVNINITSPGDTP